MVGCFSRYNLPCLATFVVVVIELSRAISTNVTSGGFRAVFLEILADLCVVAVVISRIFQVGPTENQLASQGWGTCCGLVMSVIGDCVVFPAIMINVIRVCSLYYLGQNTVSAL